MRQHYYFNGILVIEGSSAFVLDKGRDDDEIFNTHIIHASQYNRAWRLQVKRREKLCWRLELRTRDQILSERAGFYKKT